MNCNSILRHATTALIISALSVCSASALATDTSTIQTTSGPITGFEKEGISSWLGLPYAAPPVNELRWQPPHPVTPWTTVRKANIAASSCLQNADLGDFARAGGSEDCLYLNVYRPAGTVSATAKLPVFVWIHGGALQVGQGADYDPSKLVRQGKAIVVTFNYRLGVLGFLSTPGLEAENKGSGNYGLMDQQAALRWVQNNISAFGGNPSDVTIAGESSGGNSVIAHIISPGSAGLFQHAVSLSGAAILSRYPAFGAPQPLSVALKNGAAFASALECSPTDAACLRALPVEKILNAQSAYMVNQFIIDGKTIPLHPSEAFRTDKINHATLINGTTRDEGHFFVALPELKTGKALSQESYPEWIGRQYGETLKSKVLTEYPLHRYENPSEAFAATVTDSLFSCPARAMNRLLAEKIPVYAYEFSDRTAPSYIGATTFPLLASHTFELAYLFPGFHGGSAVKVSLNPLQERLSDEMVGYFAAIKDMHSREKSWPRYSAKSDNYMTFALPTAHMVTGRFADAHHCHFWDKQAVY